MANPGKSRLETERPAAEGGVNIALPGGDLGKHLTLMAVGLVAWILMYRELAGLSQWITYDVFGLAEGAALGGFCRWDHATLLHPGAHAGDSRRPARGSRELHGRGAGHSYSLLLLFGRAALHRLPDGGGTSRRDLLLPHRGPAGQ